jgi:hypothetical protein
LIDLRRFVAATSPLTLARCAPGFLPGLMAVGRNVLQRRGALPDE